jgi:uncharacterized protein (TIRG00374 family)
LVWYAFSRIDASSAFAQIGNLPYMVVASALALLFGQFALAAARCRVLVKAQGQPVRYSAALDTSMIGAFFSQTLISFVGGDAMRVWRFARYGVNWKTAAKAVLCDRILGFVGHIIVIVLGFPLLLTLVPDPRVHVAIAVLVALAFAGCLLVVFFNHLPNSYRQKGVFAFASQVSSLINELLRNPQRFLLLLTLSVAIQIGNLLVVYILARGIGVSVSFLECFALVPPVLFLALMPISVSGWGVRESALIAAFSALQVPAAQSLAVSLSYGLGMVIISLPGGLLWLLARRQSANPGLEVAPEKHGFQ